MNVRIARILFLAVAGVPFAFALQQAEKQEPTSDQVFANIKVFKGVPARDLIPAMEFMSASLNIECSDCHDAKDYSKETRMKESARNMVVMQRELNAKYFNNRLEVTCNSCHNGREHPLATPIPGDLKMRHERMENPPPAASIFEKYLAAVGSSSKAIIRTGTLHGKINEDPKETDTPAEMIQAEGKFLFTSGFGKVGSDGSQVWRDGMVMTDEPAAIFGRMGRAWRGPKAFSGLERTSVSGSEKLGKISATVVRGMRTATGSTEELYFDNKTGLLVRFTSVTRSTIGSVITVFDYSNYKSVDGVKVPMQVVVTWANGQKWSLNFKSASASDKVNDSVFSPSPPQQK